MSTEGHGGKGRGAERLEVQPIAKNDKKSKLRSPFFSRISVR